ncbi:Protein phosphatase 2C 7 [Rhizina undulata]
MSSLSPPPITPSLGSSFPEDVSTASFSTLQAINPLRYLYSVASRYTTASILRKRSYSTMCGDGEQRVGVCRYGIAAAFVSKMGKFGSRQVWGNEECINSNLSWKEKPETGQDAFFVRSVGGGLAVGVYRGGKADGVGGYASAGIDSAEFSSTLCARMSSEAARSRIENVTPGRLIEVAYQRILDEGEIPGGASTACVGVAKPDGSLEVANVGDSGFLILRQGKVLYASPPQTHTFNTPFQLAMIPKRLLQQALHYGGMPLSDLPSDANVTTHSLRNGDVVLFATDGVWDNLSNQDILRIVSDEMVAASAWVVTSEGIAPRVKEMEGIEKRVAAAVVGRAKSASVNEKVDGPFAREVQRWFPEEAFRGGKRDDICVVCLVCMEPEE